MIGLQNVLDTYEICLTNPDEICDNYVETPINHKKSIKSIPPKISSSR